MSWCSRHRLMACQLCRLETIVDELRGIRYELRRLTRKEDTIMATLADLQSEVARNTSIDESAKLLLAGLAAKIQELLDAGADPVALQTLVDQLKADNDALAEAVGANTI
jgi:chromosome segregation ATPase